MSDYRRFVSYLYEYRNGQKNQNCGFLKAELRNDLFRLEMHVKDSALSLGLSIKIYGFIRKENRLPGILLGNAKSGERYRKLLSGNPKRQSAQPVLLLFPL